MANQDIRMRVQYSAEFDTSKVSNGLKEIRKQMANSHIGDDLRKQLETALNKVEANIPALEKMSAKTNFNEKELIAYQKLIQEISKDMANLSKITAEADFTKNFSAADNEKLKQFEKQLDDVEKKLKTTRQEILNTFSKSKEGQINGKSNATLNSFIEQLISVPPDKIEDKLNEIIKEVESQTENMVEKLQEDFKNKVNHKTGKEGFIELLFGKDSGVSLKEGKTLGASKVTGDEGAYSVYSKIRDDILKLKQDASAADVQKILDAYSQFVEEYFNIPEGKQSILANIITPEILDHLKQFVGPEGIEKLKTLIGEENLKILADGEDEKIKIAAEQATFMKQALDSLVDSGKITKDQAEEIAQALGILNNQAEEGIKQIQGEKAQIDALSATFGTLAHRIESSISAMAIFNKSIQIVKKAIKSVEDLDAAFTQIAIVSERSNEEAWKMFDSFNKLAKQYSITTKDLTEGAKLFYQQGLNAADTMKMVEASTISAALGEVTMTEAANTLTAAIQGYNESAEVAMAYTDKIAMVGAVSAADFNELSAAMEKTASSAYTAGIDFDHLLGYLGKMIEVTREAPANLGTAMKTIIARFEDMKKDPMAILEDGVSANKVEAALATIGIALRDSEGEFRALQDVFDELGMKWQSLTRNQQAYIATVAAGSRQQSRFLAMMNNYDRTLDLVAESQNSAGAALKQYATYQDSVKAAQARLTASWEKFYSKIVDNDLIKTAINGLSTLVDLFSRIPPIITAIGTSIGAIGLQELLTKQGGLIKIITNLLGGGDAQATAFGIGKRLMDQLYTGLEKGAKQLDTRGGGWKVISNALKPVEKQAIIGSKEVMNFSKAAKTLGKSLKEAGDKGKTAFRGILNFVLDPKVLGILAVTTAIYVMIRAIEKASQRANDAAKEVKELNEKILDLQEDLKVKQSLLGSYDNLNKKVNRTKEEQEELNGIIKEIGETYSNAITYMDAYGNMQLQNRNALDKTTDSIEKQIRENRKLVREGQRNLLNNTPRGQWTEENLTTAGIPDEVAQRILNSRNDFKTPLDIDSILALKDSGVFDKQKAITELEKIAKEYNVYDMMSKSFEKVEKRGIGGKVIREYANTLEDITEELKKLLGNTVISTSDAVKDYLYSLDVDQYFDDLKITDPKYSGPVTYLKQMLYEMDPSKFEENKQDIALFFATLFKIEEPSKIFNITEALKKYFNGESNEKELQAICNNNGVVLGEDFIKGYLESLNKNKEIVRQNTLKVLKESLKVVPKVGQEETFYSNLSIEQLQTRSDLATTLAARGFTGQEGFKMLQDIAPYADELNDKVSEAFEKGSVNGVRSSINDIRESLDDLNLEEDTKNFILEITDDAEREIENLINKIFDDVQTKAQPVIAELKTSIDNIISGTNTKLSDTELTSSDSGVYVDNKSGELMVSNMRMIFELEKDRKNTQKDILKAYQDVTDEITILENKTTDLEPKEALRLKQLNAQKNILQQQFDILSNMEIDAEQLGWAESINLAKNYQKNLQSIQSVQDTIKEKGFLDLDEMTSVLELMPQYAKYFEEVGTTIEGVEGKIYTISEENIQNMMNNEKSYYDYKLALDRQEAIREYENAVEEYEYLKSQYGDYITLDTTATDKFIENNKDELKSTKKENEQAIQVYQNSADAELDAHANKDNQMVSMFRKALNQMDIDYEQFIQGLKTGQPINFNEVFNEINKQSTIQEIDLPIKIEDLNPDNPENRQNITDFVNAALEDAEKRVHKAWTKLQNLKEIDVPQLEKLKKEFEEAGKGAQDTGKELEALAKAAENLADALEDLDDLLKDVQRDLRDITVDYNPFTDLFEAWEAEWDYYYNIKNLINQLETQANYIDKVISSDYSSAQDKLRAYDAKVGNITSKLAANDAYILSLRAGIAQQAKEFEKEFNEYYNVDNRMGGWQIFQRDTTLNQWEETINDVKKVSFELSKLINQQENELNLMEATQEVLEQQRSAYESMLSTVDSLVDSLEDNEDITVDLTGLKGMKVKLEAAIDDGSVEEVKQQIRNLNDYIQELNWQLDLNDNVVEKGLEDAYDDMQDSMSHIQDLIDTLNDKLAEQQELVQELSEVYNYYVDTAIDMQQELYDAIVEQYQNEINQKKQQYDYLKQLDKDYLQSVKDNINKERQAREDANKEKSYQQSLQRAQLLQQDTSGAYRKELANLNKEIESQRQDLYDDLVDKQVNALEKEIEKRHELYDMEVNALQERLDYMQENAILLWEMVNDIVAEGADSMMATLENTTNYINQNELTRERQHRQWELNTQATYKGVIEGEIESLNQRIAKGKEYIDSLTEIKDAIDLNTQTYIMSKDILEDEAGKMQIVMDSYMQVWTTLTSDLTGYHENWKTTVNALMSAMEKDIQALSELGDEGGSIYILKDKLLGIADEMYDAFLEERRAMHDSLNREVSAIEAQVQAMGRELTNAVQQAANSIQTVTPQQSGSGGGTTTPTTQTTNVNPGSGGLPAEEPVKTKKYRIEVYEFSSILDYMDNKNGKKTITLGGYKSEGEAISGAQSYIESMMKIHPYKVYRAMQPYLNPYKQGGLANFTGPAWLDGTKSQPEAVLNAKQTKLFTSMVSSLERAAANNSNINSTLGSSYNIGDINTNINVDRLDNETDIDKVAKQVENRIMKSIHNRVVLSVV